MAITADGTLVEFDYRAAWNLVEFCFGCSDRVFTVNVEPAGGGSPLLSVPILTARAGTGVPDTGDQVGVVDLSAFAGQTIRLSFDFFIPDNFSGPAFFQLDNVRVAKAPWIASGSNRIRDLGPGLIRWKHIIGLTDPGNFVGTGEGRVHGAREPWTAEDDGEGAQLDLRRQTLSFSVRGLSLAGGNAIGTTGGIREVRGTLICDTDGSDGVDSALVDTPPVPLSRSGHAFFSGSVAPLPAACGAPDVAFVIRPATGPAPAISSASPAPARPATAAPSRSTSSPDYPPERSAP